jgi:hypothetical protein
VEVAEIAHSFIADEIGIDNFALELPDLILGRNPCLVSYLIGEAADGNVRRWQRLNIKLA